MKHTRKIKSFIAACLAAVTTLSVSALTVSASEVENVNTVEAEDLHSTEVDDEGFTLISKEEFVDEDNITHRICLYEQDDGISTASINTRTTKTYRATYDAEVHGFGITDPDVWVHLEVLGTFTWDGDSYIVVDQKTAKPIVDKKPGFELVGEPKFVALSDQGSNFLFGNKYAIIRVDVTMTNGFANNRQSFHLSLDVNVKGEPHLDPRKGPELEEVK